MNCLSPSILSADYCNLERDIQAADDAGAQYMHIDVMDGHFVPQITIGAPVLSAIRGIQDYLDAGADIITVHAESTVHLDRVIHMIKEGGAMAGVALNPSTPLSVLDYVLPDLDMVLIMSVNPGYGGQKFIPYTIDKLNDLQAMLTERNLKIDVEVDGGVKLHNVEEIMDAGANVIVAGSAIFHGDITENVQAFLEKM